MSIGARAVAAAPMPLLTADADSGLAGIGEEALEALLASKFSMRSNSLKI